VEAPPQLKTFAFGVNPIGIVAIGLNARGVVAVGINAVGLFAFGVNAMAGVLAVGLNALAPVALSAVNSVGLVALAFVNSIGAWGSGVVNSIVHPALGLVLGVVMVLVARGLGGRWQGDEPGPIVPMLELLAGRTARGWVRAVLLVADGDHLLVGDGDGQHALVGDGRVLAYGRELLARRRSRIYAELTAEQDVGTATDPSYRSAAGWVTVLRALALRPMARRLRWPTSKDELDWLTARSLLVAAVAGALGSAVVLALGLVA
jgi:hypothetical protein